MARLQSKSDAMLRGMPGYLRSNFTAKCHIHAQGVGHIPSQEQDPGQGGSL